MSMEINNVYNNYTGSYKKTNEKKSSEKQGAVEKTEPTESARKTAADELAYLTEKYDGYSFVGVNFKPGMKYGSKDTVNVAISPIFLKKMANNPELEEHYEKEIANMKVCDEQKVRNIEGQGDRIIAKGWAIDKDGNISSWTIGERGGNRPKVVSPNEYGAKIRKQKEEKKKAEAKIVAKQKEKAEKKKALEEKIEEKKEQNELKEQISGDLQSIMGEKYIGEKILDVSEGSGLITVSDKDKNNDDVVGLNIDMKM